MTGYKRLVKGTFQRPVVAPGTTRMSLDAAALAALLDGIDLRAPRRRWFAREQHPL